MLVTFWYGARLMFSGSVCKNGNPLDNEKCSKNKKQNNKREIEREREREREREIGVAGKVPLYFPHGLSAEFPRFTTLRSSHSKILRCALDVYIISRSYCNTPKRLKMKTAVWYTSTLFVIFIYFYIYLVQFIRGEEVPLSPRNAPQLRRIIENQPKWNPASVQPLDFSYHNYEVMTNWLKQFSDVYSNLTALYSIGKSVQGIASMQHIVQIKFFVQVPVEYPRI